MRKLILVALIALAASACNMSLDPAGDMRTIAMIQNMRFQKEMLQIERERLALERQRAAR